MKIIALVSLVSLVSVVLVGCAGADKEGSMAFSNTTYANVGDGPANPPHAIFAAHDVSHESGSTSVHTSRSGADYFVCAQCR